jgi:hypothetical protein
VHTYGVDRRTHVRACGVDKCAYMCAYGLNSRALEARLMGVKIILLMLFMVHLANLGLFYVGAGDHCAQCRLVGESEIDPS